MPTLVKEHARAAKPSRMAIAALLLAGSALLSRILGWLREAVLAHQVGVGVAADAYFAAFTIPDWLNYLLAGGALSIAFLPHYTKLREEGDEQGAEHFLATVLGTLSVLAVGMTLLLWAFAEPLVAVVFGGFSPEGQALTAKLTRIVLPAQIFFVVGGIMKATLFAQGRFGAAALAPLVYNGCIIVFGLLLSPFIGVEGFAWGVLVGAVAGPFLIPWWDSRGRVHLGFRVAPRDRAFLRYLWVALPLMLGQSLMTVDEWYQRILGARLDEGSVAYLSYARRLMLVPVAIVGQAVATAALPALAALWARKEIQSLHATMLSTLQASLSLALLATAGLWLFAEQAVTLLYQRGAFSSDDAVAVAAILRVISLAVPAWIVQQVATRAFYARNDTWRPMILGTIVAVLALPLYWIWARDYGVLGLAWASVLGMSVNAGLTVAWMRRHHGGPELMPLLGTLVRSGGVAFVALLAVYFVEPWLSQRLLGWAPHAQAIIRLLAGTLIFCLVALPVTSLVGDKPTQAALGRVLRRLRILR